MKPRLVTVIPASKNIPWHGYIFLGMFMQAPDARWCDGIAGRRKGTRVGIDSLPAALRRAAA